MATIRELRTDKEIREAVDGYCNLDKTMYSDKEHAYKIFHQKVKLKKFIRGYFDPNLIGCIYAEPAVVMHSSYVFFQQMYFYTDAKGVKAARCVKELHREMINEARRQDLAYCLSIGSHNDDDMVFTRILEKDGWKKLNFLAFYEIDPKRSPFRD